MGTVVKKWALWDIVSGSGNQYFYNGTEVGDASKLNK